MEVAISLAVTAAATGLEALLAPKPKKPPPIDRGKLDDARFSIPALGAAIPKGWGTFRCAPIWIDHVPTDHRVEVTQGSDGGKGGPPTPPTPDERKHIYTKKVIGVFHNGLVHKGVSKMWLNGKLAYNADLATNEATTSATRYEGEHGVLSGGASVVDQSECSGGRKVTGLGSGGVVTLHVDVSAAGSYEVAVFYTSTADRTFKVGVNGGSLNDLFCPASGGAGEVTSEVITLTLLNGANTIRFENTGAAAPDLDRIDIAPALVFTPEGADRRGFTGIIRPGRFGPDDPDFGWPVANELPTFSDTAGGVTNGGFYQAVLAEWGNPAVRFYNGSELQESDPIIVALRGLDLAPGYRGFGIIAIDNIQLQNGQMPNVELEVQQGMRELPAIVADIYNEVGVPASDLDLTALEGLVLGDASGFDPGTYGAISWTGLQNATAGAGGAITKTSGTDNSYDCWANSGDSVAAGNDASIRFTAGNAATYLIGFGYVTNPQGPLPGPYNNVPFALLLNRHSNPSQENKNAIQLSLGGFTNTFDVGVWSPGDKFQVEYRNGRFMAYQNGLALTGYTPPVPSTFPLRVIYAGYALGGGPSAASFAAGTNIGTEPIIANGGGLYMESPRPAAELIAYLMLRFQFDLPEVDGVVKAVRRDAAPDLTIPFTDLRAHRGDDRPESDMQITRVDPLTLPYLTNVTYSDPARSYRTRTQSEPRLYGPQRGSYDVVLPLIETAQNMKNLAIVLANRLEIEGQTYRFTLGPKYQRIHQGTVLSLPSRTGVTHTVRVKELTQELPAGIVSVQGVRQDASIFSATGAPAETSGLETPIVVIPGNTRGVILDSVLLRPGDAGDGREPVVYVGLCGRGSGGWSSGFLYREFPIASDNYVQLVGSDRPADIGTTDGTLGTVADPSKWDRINSVTINFSSNTLLQSVTESELLVNPQLNLLGFENPSTNEVEFLQFATATPLVAAAPYVTRYTISTLLRGRIGTDANVSTHTAADNVVAVNSALHTLRLPVSNIGQTLRLKFLTAGQGLDTVAAIDRTLRGNSLRPLAPSNLRSSVDSEGNRLIEWTRRSRIGAGMIPGADVPVSEEQEVYAVEILTSANAVLSTITVKPDQGSPALLAPVANDLDGPFISGNNILDPGNTHSHAYTQQRLGTGSWIEATLNASPNDGAQIGVILPDAARFLRQAGTSPPDGVFFSQLEFRDTTASGNNQFTVYYGAFSATSFPPVVYESGSLGGRQTARIRIEIGDRLRYFWDYTGSGSVPFYESVGPPPVPLVGALSCLTISNAGCSISNIRVGQTFRPSLVYTKAQQDEHSNLGVKARVYQVSAVVGRGAYAEITF